MIGFLKLRSYSCAYSSLHSSTAKCRFTEHDKLNEVFTFTSSPVAENASVVIKQGCPFWVPHQSGRLCVFIALREWFKLFLYTYVNKKIFRCQLEWTAGYAFCFCKKRATHWCDLCAWNGQFHTLWMTKCTPYTFITYWQSFVGN